jgi:tetratricopeptide (TPR) repeat protein
MALFEAEGARYALGIAAWNVGLQTKKLGDVGAAIPFLEKGLEAQAEGGTPLDRLELGRLLGELAEAYREAGRIEEALERARRGLAISDEAGRSAEVVAALVLISNLHASRSELSEAVASLRRAIEVVERLDNPVVLARLLFDLGCRERSAGELGAARSSFRRAAEIGERIGERSLQGGALVLLLELLVASGEVDEAVATGERALPIVRGVADRELEAIALRCLGVACRSQGRIADAIAAGRDALALAEDIADPSHIAPAIRDLATSYAESGETGIALRLHDRNLKLAERSNDPVEVVAALSRLAMSHRVTGDSAAAEPHLARAVGIVRLQSALSPPWGEPVVTLAEALKATGQPRQAIEILERLLQARTEMSFWHDATRIHRLLATCHAALGEASAAAECAGRSIEQCGGRCPSCEAAAFDVLRELADSRGDFVQALEFAERAARSAERSARPMDAALRHGLVLYSLVRAERWRDAVRAGRSVAEEVGMLVRTGSEEAGLDLRDKTAWFFALGALASRRAEDLESAAFFYEAGRAGLLLDALALRDAAASCAIPGDLVAEERVSRARVAEAVAASREAERSAAVAAREEARRAVEDAREKWRDGIARIQRVSRLAADVAFPSPDPLDAIRGRLRSSEALVLYCNWHATMDDAAALVVTSESARVVPLGPTEAVESACAALRAEDPGGDPSEPAAALKRLLIDPLGLDGSVTRLLVSPDGILSCIPFALLVPDREVVFVPSGTTHGVLLHEGAKRGEGVLALGDPDYGVKPPPDLFGIDEIRRSAMSLVPLPGTAEEARVVGTTVLLGKSATTKALAEALARRPRWRAVHLACHGLIDFQQPPMTSLALTPGDGDDGLLTVLDVTRLRVSADLVVLSACETGVGGYFRAEGMMGLSRAFMVAGAPRVLASLWKVDDAATLAFMKAFYASWSAGRTPAAALRDAQALVRSQPKWSHPRYWAAWVLWGLGD